MSIIRPIGTLGVSFYYPDKRTEIRTKKQYMKHPSSIENYSGSLKDLAQEIGDLKYDALASFLSSLAIKIEEDGKKDAARDRRRLAMSLFACSAHLSAAKKEIDEAWRISAPYIKNV